MKKFRLLMFSGLIATSLCSCNIIQTEAEFNSLEQSTASVSPNVPIGLKSKKRYVKHRLPQRRAVHRTHSLHSV